MGQGVWQGAEGADTGQLGDPADANTLKARVESKTVELDESIEAGMIVIDGTNSTVDDQIILPINSGASIVAGVVVRDNNRGLDYYTGLPRNYGQTDRVGVARDGVWYVYSETAVTKGNQVYYRGLANGAGQDVLGYVRDGIITGAFAMNAKFKETTAAAGRVKIELSLVQV